MNILLCCQNFYPEVGGVSKTMHEIGQRFVMRGHNVSVATSWLENRREDHVDGIKVHSFKVWGNAVTGMSGAVEEYQQFLIDGRYDFLLVMAAQQWTLDAMLPVLDSIYYRKLHIPCGYSGFYLRKYQKYYKNMEVLLRKFDQLIYNSTDYRDINFARDRKIPNINIIPAGASELEFLKPDIDHEILEKLGIPNDDFIYLTVGAPAFNKGHREIIESYLLVDLPFPTTLIMNGNYDPAMEITFTNLKQYPRQVLKELVMRLLGRSPQSIKKLAKKNKTSGKKILFTNLERDELISLYFKADIFLFASHIEYSPLVIFECLAAGLPFISIPVGNVDEIIRWSNGGILCPGRISNKGWSHAFPDQFAAEIKQLSLNDIKRKELARYGRQAWLDKFTWAFIAERIEKLVTQDSG